ncbi:MAG: MAPEG family protein [Geminicoccaceae bacterium]
MAFSVTVVFIAILALIQFPMTLAVGVYRTKTDIRFMDGGDEDMVRRIRAHANFIETVPIALLAMAAAEYAGTPSILLWIGGLMLLVGRLVHYFTIRGSGWGVGRSAGMALTFLPVCGFAILALLASSNII